MPADATFATATRLRFSKHEAQWMAMMGERWHALGSPIAESMLRGEPDAMSVRRWIAAIGRSQLGQFFRLTAARWAARRAIQGESQAPAARAVHSLYRRGLRAALTEPVDLRDLAIDGDDLRQVGIAPGPALGRILSSLLQLVLEDPRRNTRERLMDEARRLHRLPEKT